MTAFTTYIQQSQGTIGVSLRGCCTDQEAARQLESAISQAIANGLAVVWIDCQHLERLNWQGQRGILNADRQARLIGVSLHWCGMPTTVLDQLVESGLSQLLHLQTTGNYQGPQSLLHDSIPPISPLNPPTPK
ncbi:STAS domain-containing protein [Hymenobacter tibetensis]|uniref:STAS domain-containing protein n=1 Tax=Hymenobacter tibetensis TaxID=497967 RepID=A0ABY4CZX5_9BACT|nr:STAS domain-containing protein [Hymenobacter tibetensis]UOG75829.1 STAS domain-containing protein [Hymenobacter tibetensis]